MPENPIGGAVKRVFDIMAAALGLAVLSPVMVAVAICVRFFLGKPVLFRQLRPGLRGKPFSLIKFRSMTDARDSGGELLPNDARLTKFGRLLRSTSLDELPQLWNVLRGDMSLVGPRPLRMEYLELYDSEQARRHEVRPGITGWAQVNGRNLASWEERFRNDVWYVDNQSMLLDLRIIWITIWRVVARKGINRSEGITMPPFRGKPSDAESAG